MKCIKCGYVLPGQFYQCPSCGTVQNVQYPVNTAVSPYTVNPVKRRSGGETAAIVFAIIISIVSVIAAIVIFVSYTAYVASKAISEDKFNIDSFDQITSDEDFENFFKDFNIGDGNFGFNSPAGLNTPVKFKEKLYSFSEGEVETEYEVSMTGVYRGDASLKLLEGATLPIYNDDKYDIYLVRFSIRITDQDKDAIVTLPISNPAAYPSDSASIFSDEYSAIDKLNYLNKYALIGKDSTVETWIAFIVDKEEQNPNIMWKRFENKAFRNDGITITDPALVEAGAAIDKNVESDSSSSDEVTESD